jgi:ABC-2 type transport system permease protein
MAVTWLFARLRLRMLAGGLRGRTSRKLLFVAGALGGLYLAGIGFLLFAASAAGDADVRLMAASFGGAALVLGSVLFPLVWFGVDDALDPARFALLPLPRSRLVLGLLVAALLGVPAMALALAATGLLVPAAAHGGPGAAAAQAAGVVAGVLLCVAGSRATTSAFATMLRSRRIRDLAGVLLACLAALLGPLQFTVVSAAERADWDRLVAIATVIGWTPLGSAWTVGVEVAAGAPEAALGKLAITAGTVVLLLWWWSRTVESAMVGASSGTGRGGRAPRGGPVAQLLPRAVPGLPATPFGALVAREVRYWWRDAKRRANLVTIAVVGVLVPVAVTSGSRVSFGAAGDQLAAVPPVAASLTVLFVGTFATSALANQFGFDGTAYAGHITAGVPGGSELRARAVGYSLLMAPLLVAVGVVMAVLLGEPAAAPEAWGLVFAGYGAGLAVNLHLSVLAPYALPDTANPFATGSGTGLAKSLLALVAVVAAYAVAMPVLVAAALLDGTVWRYLALPVGLGYGAVAASLGCRLAGDLLDRRAPELLAAVTPRR